MLMGYTRDPTLLRCVQHSCFFMYRKLTRKLRDVSLATPMLLRWLLRKHKYESVYFYTFHKCASTLFSSYLLRNIDGLRHIDYANQMYHRDHVRVVFKKMGYVIGPIRISAPSDLDVYKYLIAPACRPEFVRDKIAIFLVRDPRDILVSSYFSFGFTHGSSPVEKVRRNQEADRDTIQMQTLDQYVSGEAEQLAKLFELAYGLAKTCERSIVLKYEDMVTNFDIFSADLCRYLTIGPSVLQHVFEESRPRLAEDMSAHRRFGRPGAFESKLSHDTMVNVSAKLEKALELFKYRK